MVPNLFRWRVTFCNGYRWRAKLVTGGGKWPPRHSVHVHVVHHHLWGPMRGEKTFNLSKLSNFFFFFLTVRGPLSRPPRATFGPWPPFLEPLPCGFIPYSYTLPNNVSNRFRSSDDGMALLYSKLFNANCLTCLYSC